MQSVVIGCNARWGWRVERSGRVRKVLVGCRLGRIASRRFDRDHGREDPAEVRDRDEHDQQNRQDECELDHGLATRRWIGGVRSPRSNHAYSTWYGCIPWEHPIVPTLTLHGTLRDPFRCRLAPRNACGSAAESMRSGAFAAEDRPTPRG